MDLAAYFDELLAMPPPPPGGTRVPRSRRRRRRPRPHTPLPLARQCTAQIVRDASVLVTFAPAHGASVQSPYFAYQSGLPEAEHGRRLFTIRLRCGQPFGDKLAPAEAGGCASDHDGPKQSTSSALANAAATTTAADGGDEQPTTDTRLTKANAQGFERSWITGDELPTSNADNVVVSIGDQLHDLIATDLTQYFGDHLAAAMEDDDDPFADITLAELANVRLPATSSGDPQCNR